MPLYGYRCTACEREFETLVRSGEVPACPGCASEALDRLVSAPTLGGNSRELVGKARAQAAREGHFSNYKRSDIPKR